MDISEKTDTASSPTSWLFVPPNSWKRQMAQNDLLIWLDPHEDLYKVHINDRYEAAFKKLDRATAWAEQVTSGTVQKLPLIVALGAPDLSSHRRIAAETAFESFDFGAGVEVDGFSGWEYVGGTGAGEWTRPVFVKPPTPHGWTPTTRLIFVVRFAPLTADVERVWASDARGCSWGQSTVQSAWPAEARRLNDGVLT